MLFKEIIGQDNIKQKLIQTVKDSRISHAQLFFGPDGSGKLALAIAYAQFINCKNKINGDSCGVCPSCIKYNKLIHPDLHFIFPVSNTKDVPKKPQSKNFINKWRELLIQNDYYINLNEWYEKIGIENKQGIINKDDCNEIIKTLSYKSYEAEYKVMIIWMVEKLYYSAAPKILKILEEPPGKTLFILVSENHDQIIKTIISRTQLVKIPKISNKDLKEVLLKKLNCTEEKAQRIVNFSRGSYKEALINIHKNEEEKDNFENFRKWMRLCFLNNFIDIHKFVSEIAKTGREKQKSFLAFALKIVREILLINYGNNDLVKLNDEELDFTQKISPYINPANGIRFSEEFNKALFHIERNANPSIVFMDLSITATKLFENKHD
ncbi:MAG: DNA polymerase III subunit delta [Bacteroidales bacterium]|jgi:DNA polymerase-3 subunit delta'|nr:DNA polymerase III subunit delta [Bacteroidales bacterium]